MKQGKKGFPLLMEWAGKNRFYIYCAVILSLIASLGSVFPYYIFYKITGGIIDGTCKASTGAFWAICLIAVIIIKIVANYLAIICSHKGAYNTLFKVRCMVTEHMAKMPLGTLNERNTGEIKYVMNESIEKLELFLAHNIPEIVLYMAGPTAIFAFLLAVDWRLGLVSIIPLIFVGIVIHFMFKRFGTFMGDVTESEGMFSTAVNEYVNGMRIIKAFHMGTLSLEKYADSIQKKHDVWVKITKATAPLYATYVVLLECGVLLLIPISGYLFIKGNIAAGVLILFSFVGSRYLTDIKPLQELGNNLSYSLNAVTQVKEILDTPIFGKGVDFPLDHTIEVRDVNFSYDKERNILKNCNLTIFHGERIAVIGESGAGKSTIVQLISRFYDVTKGKITIGNVNIKDIDYEQLLSNISVVFQNSFLTSGSIYENIAMGNSNVTLEQVRNAAKEAQIDEFIMSLPDGYETIVGNYGGRLSGGQKQRICIARAILKNSPILILDEATSAADPENQVEIDMAIENLCKGKTVIIVAHRLGIVMSCDKVAIVENGTISDVAHWETLFNRNSYFKKAWSDYNKARNMQYVLKEVESHV